MSITDLDCIESKISISIVNSSGNSFSAFSEWREERKWSKWEESSQPFLLSHSSHWLSCQEMRSLELLSRDIGTRDGGCSEQRGSFLHIVQQTFKSFLSPSSTQCRRKVTTVKSSPGSWWILVSIGLVFPVNFTIWRGIN